MVPSWSGLERRGLMAALSRPATKARRRSGEGPTWSAPPVSHRNEAHRSRRPSKSPPLGKAALDLRKLVLSERPGPEESAPLQ